MTEEVKTCKCGCGEIPKPGNDYVNHHNCRTQKNPVLCPLNDFKECMKMKCGFFEEHQYHCALLTINNLSLSLYHMRNTIKDLNESINNKMLL